jgi:hypothetical protein
MQTGCCLHTRTKEPSTRSRHGAAAVACCERETLKRSNFGLLLACLTSSVYKTGMRTLKLAQSISSNTKKHSLQAEAFMVKNLRQTRHDKLKFQRYRIIAILLTCKDVQRVRVHGVPSRWVKDHPPIDWRLLHAPRLSFVGVRVGQSIEF